MSKVAIVTGAGQGIGLAICLKMAANGIKVVLNDIDSTLCNEAQKHVNASFPDSCIGFSGDCSEPLFIETLVRKAKNTFGSIDIVVANAGITKFGDFLSFKVEDFEKVIDLNLRGTFFLTQEASKVMIEQNSGGSILFMSSVVGHQAHKNLAAYAMTKAALEMLAKNLVVELSQYKIRVNTVAPGATLTERTLEDPEYMKTWSEITPIGNPATVEDIAETVYFLTSDAAKHITGQSLVVDGGWTSVSVQP
jgi:glucose 1-dehydrogenase